MTLQYHTLLLNQARVRSLHVCMSSLLLTGVIAMKRTEIQVIRGCSVDIRELLARGAKSIVLTWDDESKETSTFVAPV